MESKGKRVNRFLSSCFSKRDANMMELVISSSVCVAQTFLPLYKKFISIICYTEPLAGNESYSKFCFLLRCFDKFLDSPIERFFSI